MTRKTAVLAALVAAIGLSGMSGLAHAQHPTDNLGHTSKASHRKTARISAKRAAAIAARHHRGRAVKVDLDRNDGRLHYDVDVVAGRRKYDVEVDAHTGRIIKSKLDDTDWGDRDDRDDDRDD